MLDFLKGIVKEICDEENIKYTLLSRDWIIRLEKNDKIAYIVGTRFSINSITSVSIASDKYATYEVLKRANISIIEHNMIFNPKFRKGFVSDFESKNEIKKYIKNQSNGKVVLKANEGSCGNDVYLCKSYFDFSNKLRKIFKNKESASLCPFYEIDTEYRVICLDDEIKLIYGKRPKSGEWRNNLSQGAEVIEYVPDDLKEELANLARKVVKELNIRFASVDIIKLKTSELLVIEVNSGVTINKYTEFVANGREIAKSIYKEAIEKMLE